VVSLLITVPIQQEVVLNLDYFVPQPQRANKFGLVFFDQKQVGTDEDMEKIVLKYDPQFNPTLIAAQADVESSQIVFNLAKKAHIFVGAIFEKF
jgi:hypothetical protein